MLVPARVVGSGTVAACRVVRARLEPKADAMASGASVGAPLVEVTLVTVPGAPEASDV
jgi:hypothetical protein